MIYVPKGKAREYTPLALNLYAGCDHGCTYCYLRYPPYEYSTNEAIPRKKAIPGLIKEVSRFRGKQVFLSFLGDPYCHAETEHKITRQVLELFLKHHVPVMILTKGGKRALRDLDLFKEFGENIIIGATLTISAGDSTREQGAAFHSERIKTLQELKQNDIKTWVSAEPVLDIFKLNMMINHTKGYVDHYKIGRMNHGHDTVDWKHQGISLINTLKKTKAQAYIKDDTAKAMGYVPEQYRKRDEFVLRGWNGKSEEVKQAKLF